MSVVTMVDNLAEKVDDCPVSRVVEYCLRAIDREKCPLTLYRVAESPLFRGCLSIEVNGKIVGTFRMSRGCPLLRGVRKRGSTVRRAK